MAKYLGETDVDVSTHPDFSKYEAKDWAMDYITMYSQIDGSHHKQWVLDQVARILKGTPVSVRLAKWDDGKEEYRFSVDEPSQQYLEWVDYMKGDFDPDYEEFEYTYDEGIAP